MTALSFDRDRLVDGAITATGMWIFASQAAAIAAMGLLLGLAH